MDDLRFWKRDIIFEHHQQTQRPMQMDEIKALLLSLRDEPYAEFQRKLLPNVTPERIVGVRTPALRAMAKELWRNGMARGFMAQLPHATFEENQLHAFAIAEIRDFATCLSATERFLPHVDNWATSDQLLPRCFGQHTTALLPTVERWIAHSHEYTVRFGIGMLLKHYLEAHFETRLLELVARVRRDEYYIRMMQTWCFAEALAKQPTATLPYIEQLRLTPWTHNKAIQKATESRRIGAEMKQRLRSLRV